MFSRKGILVSFAILILCGGAFSYGILVGRFKAFPYHDLREIWFTAVDNLGGGIASPVEQVASSGEGSFSVETEWLDIEGRKYNITGESNLHGRGGGLTKIDGNIIGIDSKGEFFRYEYGGEINSLEINIDLNYGLFTSYVEKNNLPSGARQWFRVLDITSRRIGNGFEVFIMHHYWKEKENSKVVRISMLSFDSLGELIDGGEVRSTEWDVIYESSPPLFFGDPPYRPMISNHTGGRVFVNGRDSLVVSLGDYHMNGVDYEPGPVSQDDSSSYGKILRIGIKSGDQDILAKGVRNPQGLYIDEEGRIWETEHGPYGGDELNLIREGQNYGWPYVTYGRSEGGEWPHRIRSHPEHVRPIYIFEPRTGISNLIRVKSRPEQWEGDLLVSALAGLRLYRVRVRENRVIHVEAIQVGERIRDLIQTDDGGFVLLADNARLIELWPADSDQSPLDADREIAE